MGTQNLATDKPRILWMDVARVIAIVMVIMTHAREIGSSVPYAFSDATPWLVKSLCNDIDRLGVPLFLAISGALILLRAGEMSVGDYFRRYGRRVLQFVLLVPVYCLDYQFYGTSRPQGDIALGCLVPCPLQ